jgi:hypothetical protein
VVLVSDARTPQLQNITQHAIDTAGSRSNVIILESNRQATYHGAQVIYPDAPFGYNKYLNLGAQQGTAEFIFFGNNDLSFTDNWDTELITQMLKQGAESASPICPASHAPLGIRPGQGVLKGYNVFSRFCGWAFLWTRQLYHQVGKLDEDFIFWCSDNATVEQLIKHKKKHVLVTSSVVHHRNDGSNTIDLLDSQTTYDYSIEELKKYNRKFNRSVEVDSSWKLPKNLLHPR